MPRVVQVRSGAADRFGTDRFEANRNRLASLAYRLLGDAGDAEDIVQDAFLHWEAADRKLIKVPEAWLTKVVTNLCLDRLRSARHRRERTSGTWLPEPLLEGDPLLGPEDTYQQRESVSLAVLTLMERLSPVERAVYVLREAFSYTHAEIADLTDISPSASQQHLHRARVRIAASRRRTDDVDPASARRVVEEFLSAAASGRTEPLVALLTEDATAVSDGAGLTKRLLNYPVPQRIAAVARANFHPTAASRVFAGEAPTAHHTQINGTAAVVFVLTDQVVGSVAFDLVAGKIATIYGVAAPSRLHRLREGWRLHRPEAPPIPHW